MKTFLYASLLLLSCTAHAQIIYTVAGGGLYSATDDSLPATSVEISPVNLALDAAGNIYFGDEVYDRVCKVNTAGYITIIAGDDSGGYTGDGGPARLAKFNHPAGIAVDNSGNVYICDYGNNCVRRVNAAGIITTVAGNGAGGYNGDNIPATAATMSGPWGISLDKVGNLYIADCWNNRIRKVDTSGIITTVAGTGIASYNGDNIQATTANVGIPRNVRVDAAGNIYIADAGNHRVRLVNTSGIITTFAGNGTADTSGDGGPATAAALDAPFDVAIDPADNVYICDGSFYSNIRKVRSGIITTIAGRYTFGYYGDGGPASAAQFSGPDALAIDASGGLYVCDEGNQRIRYITSVLAVPSVDGAVGVSVYPNPVLYGSCTLEVTTAVPCSAVVNVVDALGRTIKTMNIAANKPEQVALNVPAGVYWLTVTTPYGVRAQELCVAH